MLELLETNFPHDATFTLQQIYPVVEEHLQKQYPNNNTIRHTIRKNMQNLREDGLIEFVDNNGNYRWATEITNTSEPIEGYIYVIKDLQLGGYKIGKTYRLTQRMAQLKVGDKAEIVGIWSSPNYGDLERILHTRWKTKRIPQSEWFALSSKELKEVAMWLNDNASQEECKIHPGTPKESRPWTVVLACGLVLVLCFSMYFDLRAYVDTRIDLQQRITPQLQLKGVD